MLEVENKALYEAAKSFATVATRLLASYLKQGARIAYTTFEKHTFHGDSGLSKDYAKSPWLDFLVYDCEKQIQDLPEYGACVKVMKEDPIISKHLDCPIGTWDARSTMTAWEYLNRLLVRQTSHLLTKPEFNQEIFDKTYSDMEYFFYHETIPFKAFSPIYNFDSDIDEIDLGEGLRIRRVDKRELEKLLDESESFSQLSLFELMTIKYAVEFVYEVKKEFGDLNLGKVPQSDPMGKAHALVAALRLFKQGYIGVSMTRISQILDVLTISGRSSGLARGIYTAQKFELKETEVNDFKLFWNHFNEVDLTGLDYLTIAIRRFNYAYERGNLEDKLIDYLIAFEALFFKENETGEFRHKLSTRAARFIEHEYDKRKTTAENISDFYDKRSRVVHGEKVELKRDYVTTIEDYLRRSIRRFLESVPGSTHNDIISKLDLT